MIAKCKISNMFTNPLSYFRHSDGQPPARSASEVCCSALKSAKKRIFDVSTAAFSGIGNWPFYGVAASFGNRYSSALGSFLGACEFGSYFLFRISNFREIRQKLFVQSSENKETILPLRNIESSDISLNDLSTSELEDEKSIELRESNSLINKKTIPSSRSINWKGIAIKTAIAGLGIIAQFPIMVLVYYGNDKSLFYPLITGACEASFTILSLLMSFQSKQSTSPDKVIDPALERKRKIVIELIDRFIEELPEKYKDPVFSQKIDDIFTNNSMKSNDERGRELLNLILEARGLPELEKGPYDKKMNKIATALGVLIAAYLTTVNGAVTYQGTIAAKPDAIALGVLATLFVSLANIKLLGKLCIDSAKSYYAGIRDIVKGQYRPPLACVTCPRKWLAGRVMSTALSWSSFGTTAVSARDYIPKAGNALISLAPTSSALLLGESLNETSDQFTSWINSRSDVKAKQFTNLSKSVLNFKELLQNADIEALGKYLRSVPDLNDLPPRPRSISSITTPLLQKQPA